MTYAIHATDHCGDEYVFEVLGSISRTDADAALAIAWAGVHECLSMWIEAS